MSQAPDVFVDPSSDEEYVRIPAEEFPDGDELESTDFTEPATLTLLSTLAPSAQRGEFGWTANDRSVIASYTIPGTTRRIALRKGDCSVVLLDFMAWFDAEIERVDTGQLDDWGYAERTVRGSNTVWSRHAWGGAGDLNALKHPMGRHNTFSEADQRKIRAKVREYSGVLRWGGDYRSRPDDMHIEINSGPDGVRREANRIRARRRLPPQPVDPRIKPAPNGYTPEGDRILGIANPPLVGRDVEGVRNALRHVGNHNLPAKGPYDRAMANLMVIFKRNRGIVEPGVGRASWAALRKEIHG